MKKDSFIRVMKRNSMKERGNTFARRVQEAVRLGKPVQEVTFEFKAAKRTFTMEPDVKV